MIHFNEATYQALEFIRQIVMALPSVTEKICFETPAFYVNKKIFARINEDCKNLVLYNEDRDFWMNKAPETYFITPHYKNYKYMLVSLDRVEPEELKQLLFEAWQKRAPKTLIKQMNL
ncbi:MmcQ/YjbR family DNA-binding protein [Pedobacter jamesrossensis]|uniref:MmcQ/YjbR family DNA-binding protein n=1 Tax=Pedobacter jamesrossensis TaxID=1908238 RepID=A0ABV8NG59_9SPHI